MCTVSDLSARSGLHSPKWAGEQRVYFSEPGNPVRRSARAKGSRFRNRNRSRCDIPPDDPFRATSADHSRAECFARLVLTGREDHHDRNLLGYAECTADRLAMHWEKTLAWLSISLHADSVDETTLTGIGFNDQDVRHATVMQPPENETAMAYAERLAAYNEPEAFAVGEAMLDESADTNPTVPTGTTDTAREQAIGRLRSAHAALRAPRRAPEDDPNALTVARPTVTGAPQRRGNRRSTDSGTWRVGSVPARSGIDRGFALRLAHWGDKMG